MIARHMLVTLLAAGAYALLPFGSANAQPLDLPIIERADDGLDTCALGEVSGLKQGGDGFLAVRTAPGSDYAKIDQVYNGDKVWVFNQVGDWLGIVYGVDEVDCSPVEQTIPVRTEGKKGWVHSAWVTGVAG